MSYNQSKLIQFQVVTSTSWLKLTIEDAHYGIKKQNSSSKYYTLEFARQCSRDCRKDPSSLAVQRVDRGPLLRRWNGRPVTDSGVTVVSGDENDWFFSFVFQLHWDCCNWKICVVVVVVASGDVLVPVLVDDATCAVERRRRSTFWWYSLRSLWARDWSRWLSRFVLIESCLVADVVTNPFSL